MTSPTRGYVTLATGNPDFLEMAVDMALSLRQHSSLPVAIACDEPLGDLARSRFGTVFDEVTKIPERFLGGRSRKFGVPEATPFEEAAFVDADCIVLGPLDHLFASLADADLAFLGEQLTTADDENHHGFSTRWLMGRFDLERYLKTNSGIFTFRRTGALEVMEALRVSHETEVRPRLRWALLRGAWVGDEIPIGVVGGRLGIRTLPEPHAMYWPHEFADIDLDRPTKPLLHMIWPPGPELFQALLADMTARRDQAGVPPGGVAAWRSEVRSLERMRRRRRFLEFVRWW